MNKMREEFESWVLSSKVCVSKGARVEVRNDGHYTDGRVDLQWKAWKASRAALCVELPDGSYCGFEGDAFHAYMCGVESCRDIIAETGVSYK